MLTTFYFIRNGRALRTEITEATWKRHEKEIYMYVNQRGVRKRLKAKANQTKVNERAEFQHKIAAMFCYATT